MDIRHFDVLTRPIAKERPRLVSGRVITPTKTKDYERKVRDSYNAVHGHKAKYTENLSVDVYIFFKNKTHGDIDNILKSVFDGLNNIAWNDDKQVKEVNAYLIVDKAAVERVEMTIRPLDSDFQERVEKKLEDCLNSITEEE